MTVARTLPTLVAHHAERAPDAPALVAGDVRWTYAQLDDAAARAAGALGALGVSTGSVVGLLATNSARWPAVALGAQRLGARVDAFATWAKAWELDHLLAASGCEVLVTSTTAGSTDLLAELAALPHGNHPALRRIVVLDDTADTAGATNVLRWTDLPDGPVAITTQDSRGIAFVLYTSGSTARPKAVPLLHDDLITNGLHIGDQMGLGPDDRVWLGSPLFWSYGSANAMMATLTHGSCLVLQERFRAEETARLFAEERCTAAYLLPAMIHALLPLREQIGAVESLRTGLTIGRPDEVRAAAIGLGISGICNVYGSTEVYGNCCVTPHDLPLELRLVSQGGPLPGVELRVVDEHDRPAEEGELLVRGRVTPGYLGGPPLGDWFRTGDRVRLRPDGMIEFQARLTDMIKTSGINVSPAEVEEFLCLHDDVTEAVVVGVPHPRHGEVPVAFVRGDVDPVALREWCVDRIAGYKVPWDFIVVQGFPTTGTGKLDRAALVASWGR